MTRAEINEKYGIVRIMRPSVANEELSPEEAKEYERLIQILVKNFEEEWDDDDSGDVDFTESEQIANNEMIRKILKGENIEDTGIPY